MGKEARSSVWDEEVARLRFGVRWEARSAVGGLSVWEGAIEFWEGAIAVLGGKGKRDARRATRFATSTTLFRIGQKLF